MAQTERYAHSPLSSLLWVQIPIQLHKLPSWCFTGRVIHQCVCRPSDGRYAGYPICQHSVDVNNPMVSSAKSGQALAGTQKKIPNSCSNQQMGIAVVAHFSAIHLPSTSYRFECSVCRYCELNTFKVSCPGVPKLLLKKTND